MDYEFGHGSTRQVLCFMWQQLVLLGGFQLVAGWSCLEGPKQLHSHTQPLGQGVRQAAQLGPPH